MARISKKAEKAMKIARREVRKAALRNPKRKKSVIKPEPHVITRWVKDEWGTQGEVFFDGHCYWLIKRDCINSSLTIEKWEERKKSKSKVIQEKTQKNSKIRKVITKNTKKKKGKIGAKGLVNHNHRRKDAT